MKNLLVVLVVMFSFLGVNGQITYTGTFTLNKVEVKTTPKVEKTFEEKMLELETERKRLELKLKIAEDEYKIMRLYSNTVLLNIIEKNKKRIKPNFYYNQSDVIEKIKTMNNCVIELRVFNYSTEYPSVPNNPRYFIFMNGKKVFKQYGDVYDSNVIYSFNDELSTIMTKFNIKITKKSNRNLLGQEKITVIYTLNKI